MAPNPDRLLPKPSHGSPCNAYGRCCVASLCPLGTALFGHTKGPCPALEAGDDGRQLCGVVRNPARYAPARTRSKGAHKLSQAALWLIGSGRGCDALGAGEPPNAAFRAANKTWRDSNQREISRAGAVWGMKAKGYVSA